MDTNNETSHQSDINKNPMYTVENNSPLQYCNLAPPLVVTICNRLENQQSQGHLEIFLILSVMPMWCSRIDVVFNRYRGNVHQEPEQSKQVHADVYSIILKVRMLRYFPCENNSLTYLGTKYSMSKFLRLQILVRAKDILQMLMLCLCDTASHVSVKTVPKITWNMFHQHAAQVVNIGLSLLSEVIINR